jgi:hypothetical protein
MHSPARDHEQSDIDTRTLILSDNAAAALRDMLRAFAVNQLETPSARFHRSWPLAWDAASAQVWGLRSRAERASTPGAQAIVRSEGGGLDIAALASYAAVVVAAKLKKQHARQEPAQTVAEFVRIVTSLGGEAASALRWADQLSPGLRAIVERDLQNNIDLNGPVTDSSLWYAHWRSDGDIEAGELGVRKRIEQYDSIAKDTMLSKEQFDLFVTERGVWVRQGRKQSVRVDTPPLTERTEQFLSILLHAMISNAAPDLVHTNIGLALDRDSANPRDRARGVKRDLAQVIGPVMEKFLAKGPKEAYRIKTEGSFCWIHPAVSSLSRFRTRL